MPKPASGCLFAILKLFGLSRSDTKTALPYRHKNYLLTQAERSLFGVLNEAVKGWYLIFAKARLADLVWMPKAHKDGKAASTVSSRSTLTSYFATSHYRVAQSLLIAWIPGFLQRRLDRPPHTRTIRVIVIAEYVIQSTLRRMAMNEPELNRVQDDLEIMRQAIGLRPPQLAISHVWGFLWLAFTGFLLIAIALFPGIISNPWGGWLVLACWIALPVRGLVGRLVRTRNVDFSKAESALPKFYSLTVLSFGLAFFVWARLLQLSWPVTMGMLFFIEALPLLIVAVAEPWRRAGIGLALTLVTCGLGVPFVKGNAFGLLLGGAIFAGCSLSAGILYWQLTRHEQYAAEK